MVILTGLRFFILRLQLVSLQPMVSYVILIAKNNVIEVKIIWECKNYANPPSVLEMWVLEVGGISDKEVADWNKSQDFPKHFILNKYNNFWIMRSSPYGLFILVDYPLTSNLKGRELYCYIHYKNYSFIKIWGCGFFVLLLPVFWSRKLVLKLVNRGFLWW